MRRITTAGVAVRDGKFLMARRKRGSSPLSGMWEFPGGKLRHGESPEDALKREFLEEFGLSITVGSFILEAPFENESKRYLMKVYAVRIVSGEPVLREHDEIRWVTQDEMRVLPCGYSDTVIVRRLLSEGIRSPFPA